MKNNLIKLFPSNFKGEVSIPSSKSFTHRALIAAALASGESIIENVNLSEDIEATIHALESIGARFTIKDRQIVVKGTKKIKIGKDNINCNESGSTLRFMIPILSLSNKQVRFTGKESLLKRPMDIYKDIFQKSNASFITNSTEIVVNGSIKPNIYEVNGNVSSQFITGLLFVLPLLDGESKIIINGKFESKSYVNLTIQTLKSFGIIIQETDDGYLITGNQKYRPTKYKIEGDYSQAAFFLVGGVLNGSVKCSNLDLESLQGDAQIIDIIQSMGGKIIFNDDSLVTIKSDLKGTTIDISNCPDLGPIVALLGAFAKGSTHIINAGRLRLKESDRIHSTVDTLSKLGATIKAEDDRIIIYGKKELKGGTTVDSYNDHRIAMMVSIAASLSENPVTLSKANAVNKSYPTFYKDYSKIGGKYQVKE
jgi:3-phosphoshikimate 1-carboxyvinyltransferase